MYMPSLSLRHRKCKWLLSGGATLAQGSAELRQRLWLLLGKHAQCVFQCGMADCFVACFSIDFSLFLLIFLFPGHSCSTLIFQRLVFEQLPATPLGTDLAFLCYLKNKYETINRKIKITQCFWSPWDDSVWILSTCQGWLIVLIFFFFASSYPLHFLFVPQNIFPNTLQLSNIKLYASWSTTANYIFAVSDQSLC